MRKERPAELRSVTTRRVTDHGSMFITITYKRRGKPFEVFTHIGKAGTCERGWLEAITRSISTGLRSGVKATEYVTQLRNIKCQPIANGQGGFTQSPADAIAAALGEFISGSLPDLGNDTTRSTDESGS